MSGTKHFAVIDRFPYCLSNPPSSPADVVSNLTLQQVMNFFWNLESISITFDGSVTNSYGTYNFTNSMSVFPPSGTVVNQGKFYDGGMFPTANSIVSLSSLPQSPRFPYERVCATNQNIGFLFSDSSSSGTRYCDIKFSVCNDTVNYGMYSISYEIDSLWTGATGSSFAQISFINPNRYTGGTVGNSGSISISGINFPWYFVYSPPDTFVNGTMSATSSSFTY